MRLEAENVVVRYPGAAEDALRGVSVSVASGELVAVVGPSGSGKSTLLMALAALLAPERGRVASDGADVLAGDVVAFRRRLGVVFQSPEDQLFGSTVAEEVGFAPLQQGLAGDEIDRRVGVALDQVGLPAGMATRNPFTLSGGEQRRVALASALASEPELLLLDEPTASLDAAGREDLIVLVRRLVDAGRGALVVSHDASGVLGVADRVYVVADGGVAWEGAAARLRADPAQARAHGIEPSANDVVAAALRERGLTLEDRRWDARSLADAIAPFVEGAR